MLASRESTASPSRRGIPPDVFRKGPLVRWLAATDMLDLGMAVGNVADDQRALFAGHLLHECADYRGALQGWFSRLRIGGHLIVVVSNALSVGRDEALTPRFPDRARGYTPAALLQEVEEALVPNSYRVRWLGEIEGDDNPSDQHGDVALVLERIAPPPWGLSAPLPAPRPAPGFAFEPVRTRAEMLAHPTIERILALKLDRIGDFIRGVPALERLRATFPTAHLILVVGSWNETLARDLGIADDVLVFDASASNSAAAVPFEALVDGAYDLAIDLCADAPTRPLLRDVRARLRAGLGNRGQFPFLDIFLPIDPAAGAPGHAWSIDLPLAEFHGRPEFNRTRFHITADAAEGEATLISGPDRRLPPGDYLYQPAIEIDRRAPGLLAWDIACDSRRIAYGQFDAADDPWIPFTIVAPDGRFEARLFAVPDVPALPFRFYGGRLAKSGPAAGLHQSECLALLVELVALRTGPLGLFEEQAP